MIAAHHLVFGKQYSSSFIFNWYAAGTLGGRTVAFGLSCYEGTFKSGFSSSTVNSLMYDFTTSTDYTNDPNLTSQFKQTPDSATATIAKGFKDVYSLAISRFNQIADWEEFIKPFTKLYSVALLEVIDGGGISEIAGNLIKLPDSVEKLLITSTFDMVWGLTHPYIDLSEIKPTQKLKYIRLSQWRWNSEQFNVYGDLGKLPNDFNYLYLTQNVASTFTYTQGKTWASSFDTLNLGNAKLGLTDTDNLLIDMNNSITTAIGSKVINLANCLRSSTSDTAVAGLTAKGFTVTCTSIGAKHTITFDLGQNVTINGSVTRAEGHDGRLNAIQFGSGNLVSADPLPASPIWSIAFWVKTTQTTNYGIFAELTTNFNSNPPAFFVWHNQFFANRFHVGYNQAQSQNQYKSVNTQINDGQWHHIAIIMDRTQSMMNEISVYADKILTTLTHVSSVETSGNFRSDKLYIGGRGSTYTNPFVGTLSPIKMFNYPLSQNEIDNLYNE